MTGPALPAPARPAPIEVTRFQVALNVDAVPPPIDDVEFKPRELLPRKRAEPRQEPAEPPIDPAQPAMIVDRPVPVAADWSVHDAPPAIDDRPAAADPPDVRDTVPGFPPLDRAERAGELDADQRTPGSALVLPANPLHDLSDESLEGFIDCTLYEETENIFRPGDEESSWPAWNDDEPGGPPVRLTPPPQAAAPRLTPPRFSPPRLTPPRLTPPPQTTVPALPFDTTPNLTVRAEGGSESLSVAPDDPSQSRTVSGELDSRRTAAAGPAPSTAARDAAQAPGPEDSRTISGELWTETIRRGPGSAPRTQPRPDTPLPRPASNVPLDLGEGPDPASWFDSVSLPRSAAPVPHDMVVDLGLGSVMLVDPASVMAMNPTPASAMGPAPFDPASTLATDPARGWGMTSPPGAPFDPAMGAAAPMGPGMGPAGPGMGPARLSGDAAVFAAMSIAAPGQAGSVMGPTGPVIGPMGPGMIPGMGPAGPGMGPAGPGMGPAGPGMGPPGPGMGPPGPGMDPARLSGDAAAFAAMSSPAITAPEPSGSVMGPSGPVMGPSGPVMGPSGPVMGPSGPVMGPSGPVMGPSGSSVFAAMSSPAITAPRQAGPGMGPGSAMGPGSPATDPARLSGGSPAFAAMSSPAITAAGPGPSPSGSAPLPLTSGFPPRPGASFPGMPAAGGPAAPFASSHGFAVPPPHAEGPPGVGHDGAHYPRSRAADLITLPGRRRLRISAEWQRWLLIAGSAILAIVLAFAIARAIRGPGPTRPRPPAGSPVHGEAPAAAPGRTAPAPARTPAPARVAAQPLAPASAATATVETAIATADPEDRSGAGDPAGGTPAAADPPGASGSDAAEIPDDGEALAGGAPVSGSGPCRFTIATTPAGSIVRIDDQPMGASPITIESSCDRHKVDVSHVRYQSVTRWVTPTSGKADQVDINLPRPVHAVTVTSFPPGAELSIDGHRAGTTPTVVQMMGFATVNLTFTKPGFQTVTRKVYSRLSQDRVFVKLMK